MWSPTALAYSAEAASAAKAGQPWSSGIFGETHRAYSAEVASATKAGSMSSFAKASAHRP
jgi:hypothetical protein